MTVAATSKAALYALIDSKQIGRSASLVLEHIIDNPGCTANEIERALDMRSGSVSGRVNGLKKAELVVWGDACKRDPETRKSVNTLYHRDATEITRPRMNRAGTKPQLELV